MNMTTRRSRPVSSCGSRVTTRLPRDARHHAFTLVELLVTIGIIVILVGILVPAISMVRKGAYNAKTQQVISQLTSAIQAYHMDFRAYPGPVANANVGVVASTGIVDAAGNAVDVAYGITMAENLYLGLGGGLRWHPTVANTIQFHHDGIDRGPRNLTPTGTKANALYRGEKGAYVESLPYSRPSAMVGGIPVAWRFADGIGQAYDTIIPEYLDAYTAPLPILYLRATTGAGSAAAVPADNPVVTTSGLGQYQLRQVFGYTTADIGEGKDDSKMEKFTNQAEWPSHGLRSVNLGVSINPSSSNYYYPYDAYAYFGDPGFYDTGTGRFTQSRQKDGFVLISAGQDRIYGTEDDITSFGKVNP